MAGILDAYKEVIGPAGRAVQGRSPKDLANLAKLGLLPFNDAMALKQMADEMQARAQAMQVQQMPQPQPTVVDDLRAQVAGSAAIPFREGGLAGLPVQNIGTQAMASGGIVAFDGGGRVQEIEQRLKIDDEIKSEVGGSLGRMITRRALPLGVAERRRLEQELSDLKSGVERPKFVFEDRKAETPAPAGSMTTFTPTPASPGSPFDIAGNLMPQPSPFGGAQGVQGFSAPTMSQAELRELLRTDPYVSGGGGGAGIASLARNAYRPATDALAAQLKDIQGRKYDTAADYEKAGIGAASKAQEERIQKDLAKMPEDKRFAALMALSEAGFRMAGEASKPGATFLGAAAAGGTEGLKSYVAGRKELREREERLGDKQSALAEKREELRRAALDQDAALRRGDQKSAQEIAVKIAELESDARKLEIQMRDSAATRQTMLARDQDPNRRMTSAYYQAKLSGNEPRAQQILAAIAEIRGVDVQLLKAQLDADSRIKSAEIRATQSNPFSALGGLGGGLNQAVMDELARRQGQ